MKKKIKTLIGIASFAMLLGAGLGLINSSNEKVAVAEEYSPVSTDTKIYINTYGAGNYGDWDSGTLTMAWIFGNEDTEKNDKWVSTTAEEGLVGIKSFTMPAGYTGFIAVRFSTAEGEHPNDGDPNSPTNWWNKKQGQSYNIYPEDSYNYIKLTTYKEYGDCQYEVGHVHQYAGTETIYLDIRNYESWWFNAPYDTYVYFGLGASADNRHCYKMNRVGNSNILSYTLEEAFKANLVLFYRGTGIDFAGKTDQTPDIIFDTTNESNNAFKLGYDSEKHEDYQCIGMEDFSDAYVADSFGYYFLNDVAVCLDDGGLADGYATAWSNSSDVYTDYEGLLISKTYIKLGSNATEDNLGRALLRYDTARAKNPGEFDGVKNYLSRDVITLNGLGNRTTIAETNRTTLFIVISVVVVCMTSLFFFYRKKRA